MSSHFIARPLVRTNLATVIVLAMMNYAYAANEQDEVQKLRAEVQELRHLLEQYVPQAKSTARLENSNALPAVTASSATSTKSMSPSLTTKSGAQVQLYGFVRGDAAYQIEGGDKMFNRINTVGLGDDSRKDKFDATVTTTRIGLDFKAPVAQADLGGKIEIDFRGGSNNDSTRIRHAYLTYDHWLIGQTTSSFLAGDLQPDMLDFNSPLGVGTYRTPMVRYSDKINSQTTYFVGLEKANDNNRVPALTSKIKYDFADGKASTSWRALLTEARSDNESDLGWGVGLGVRYQLTPALLGIVDYSHVKGDNKYLLYSNDAYKVDPNDDSLNLNEFDTFTVGATYKFSPKLSSTLAYGAMFANDDNEFAKLALNDSRQNKKLQQGWVNVMYSPISPFTLGLEYIYGERETFTGEKGKDNRIEAMAKYSF